MIKRYFPTEDFLAEYSIDDKVCHTDDVAALEQAAAQMAEALGIAKCRIEQELEFNRKNNYPTTLLRGELAGIETALAAYREVGK